MQLINCLWIIHSSFVCAVWMMYQVSKHPISAYWTQCRFDRSLLLVNNTPRDVTGGKLQPVHDTQYRAIVGLWISTHSLFLHDVKGSSHISTKSSVSLIWLSHWNDSQLFDITNFVANSERGFYVVTQFEVYLIESARVDCILLYCQSHQSCFSNLCYSDGQTGAFVIQSSLQSLCTRAVNLGQLFFCFALKQLLVVNSYGKTISYHDNNFCLCLCYNDTPGEGKK